MSREGPVRIAFLTPEFPGQTHGFIWHERAFLQEAGIEVSMISTRRPHAAIMSQEWAARAQSETTYLRDGRLRSIVQAVGVLLAAGPRRLFAISRELRSAEGLHFAQRLRLTLAVLAAARLVHCARRDGWSHVHVHSCAEAAHVALLASRLSDLTYSLAFLGPTLWGYGPNQANKWRNARFATVMSDAMHQEVERRLSGHLPANVKRAPLGVVTSFFDREAPYRAWEPGSPCTVYSCGRLNPVKGHTDLVDAIISLRHKGVDARLSIAGEDEQGGAGYRIEFERFIREREATGFVSLLGAVSAEESRNWLGRAHVFALASLNEGVSVAVMEALAMQVPTVCTRVGGMHELVDSGVNGVMVSAREPEALALAILDLLQDPERAVRLGQAGRATVEARYGHSESAQTLIACLRASGVIPEEGAPDEPQASRRPA